MAAVAVAALLALVYWVAQPASETVTLLPSADGHKGVLVVQRGDKRVVLDQPYATTTDGAPVAIASAAQVRDSFAATLAALPAPPAVFTLYFVTGTDELTEESKTDLQRILEALKGRPVPDVYVIGHTDTVGEYRGNDRLSAQRAETVKGFLVGIGIPSERIETAGRGERELVVPTAEDTDEPLNRRVEINVR